MQNDGEFTVVISFQYLLTDILTPSYEYTCKLKLLVVETLVDQPCLWCIISYPETVIFYVQSKLSNLIFSWAVNGNCLLLI